jgi:beta-phosphoglucomutase
MPTLLFASLEESMSIQHVDCILLDLDGLLVDTEGFHYRAYKEMCQTFGYALTWDFDQYLSIAGASSSKIQEQLKILFPALFKKHGWAELYACKQKFLYNFLETEAIPLMPYVEEGFTMMVQTGLPIGVVTHSSLRCLEIVRSVHSFFSPVKVWIGREEYKDPKPSPDCYKEALQRLQVPPSRALGFEDTFRGICALRAAGCRAVLVNGRDAEAREACARMKVDVYSSLDCVPTVLLSRKKRTKLCG